MAATPRTVRARVRDELSREIRAVARRQLAEHGSSGLSLRAVAREVGMVSSAIYRYYPSRDDLLTALIIEAYRAVGAAAELAEAGARRSDHLGRWLALTGAVRDWAAEHPQEYALIFGSPVPGYQAPRDTVDPAARIPLLIMAILHDAARAGRPVPVADRPIPRSVRADLKALRATLASDLPEHQLGRAVLAWTQLIGSISFELFGHLHGVITDYPAYFGYQMGRIGHELGLDLKPGSA